MKITGKVVAITGGARGIGRATAAAFVDNGAKVAIGDLDAVQAKQAAAEIGSAAVGLELDVTSKESFAKFLDSAEAALGPVDVLINNAGIMPTGRFLDETEAMTDRMIDINIRGVVTGSRIAAKRFAARGSGHVVNIASLAGVTGEPGLATYCGTKHFVVGFTEALYRELHEHGVGVTMILPGVIDTELSRGTKVPAWAKPLATARPKDVAAGIVAAVEHEKPSAVVPAALGAVLKTMSILPSKARFTVHRALRFDQLVSGADPKARAAYHQRLAEQQR